MERPAERPAEKLAERPSDQFVSPPTAVCDPFTQALRRSRLGPSLTAGAEPGGPGVAGAPCKGLPDVPASAVVKLAGDPVRSKARLKPGSEKPRKRELRTLILPTVEPAVNGGPKPSPQSPVNGAHGNSASMVSHSPDDKVPHARSLCPCAQHPPSRFSLSSPSPVVAMAQEQAHAAEAGRGRVRSSRGRQLSSEPPSSPAPSRRSNRSICMPRLLPQVAVGRHRRCHQARPGPCGRRCAGAGEWPKCSGTRPLSNRRELKVTQMQAHVTTATANRDAAKSAVVQAEAAYQSWPPRGFAACS